MARPLPSLGKVATTEAVSGSVVSTLRMTHALSDERCAMAYSVPVASWMASPANMS